MIATLFWFCIGSIFYTYAGYPLFVTLLARFRPNWIPVVRARAEQVPLPKVTLLIAAYNEEDVIAEKLENSLALDYPAEKLQILVTADGSDDRTPGIVHQFENRGVELSYSPPRRGKMAAINRAMPSVTGEIVIFSDANNLYAANTIKELVIPFVDPSVGAVSGAKTILKGNGALGSSEGLYWRYESFIKQQETRLGTCTGVAGEILAIRHNLFESPPDEIINDDFYMGMRLLKRGYRIVYTPTARSSERVSPLAQHEVTRRSRIIAGRYQAIARASEWMPSEPLVAWQVISHKVIRPLVPLAMIGAFLSNLVAVIRTDNRHSTAHPTDKESSLYHLTSPFSQLFLILQLLFYMLAFLPVERKGVIGKLLYLPTFLVNSNKAALIGLYRFVTKRQSTLWKRVPRS